MEKLLKKEDILPIVLLMGWHNFISEDGRFVCMLHINATPIVVQETSSTKWLQMNGSLSLYKATGLPTFSQLNTRLLNRLVDLYVKSETNKISSNSNP